MLIRRRALEVRIHNEKDARTISAAGLNTSPKLRAYIRSLSNSSFTSVLRCLVSGAASSLDAFSSYPSGRGYPALPCQTTGKLVAPSPRSSRTKGPLPSDTLRDSTTKQHHVGLTNFIEKKDRFIQLSNLFL